MSNKFKFKNVTHKFHKLKNKLEVLIESSFPKGV